MLTIDYCGHKVDIEITHYTPGRSARIRYDEDDHPDEPPEIDWVFADEDTLYSQIVYEHDEVYDEFTELVLKAMDDERVNILEEAAESRYRDLQDKSYD